MDFELRRAREKLQKEQKERKEMAKLKLQRERKAKEEASRQRAAIEEVQRARRIDAAEAQVKVRFNCFCPNFIKSIEIFLGLCLGNLWIV